MRLVFASALALLFCGAPSYAQDEVQQPQMQTVPQQQGDQAVPQPQDQPAEQPQQPGVGGAGDQQPIPQQPPAGPTLPPDVQPGVGGAGDQQQACPCASCPMHQGMRGGMMMGPMGFGPRLGQIADIEIENTREGAVIRFKAKQREQTEEVQSLALALGSQWAAMAIQMQQAEQRMQQQQPAQQ